MQIQNNVSDDVFGWDLWYALMFLNKKAEDIANGTRSIQQKLTLWQYILDLLIDPSYNDVISWVYPLGSLSFKVHQPDELARMWSRHKQHSMQWNGIARSLRLYKRTQKPPIIYKPGGQHTKKFTYYLNKDWISIIDNCKYPMWRELFYQKIGRLR